MSAWEMRVQNSMKKYLDRDLPTPALLITP